MARAREWALRSTLELSRHHAACWATLTYSDAFLPPTLSRYHLQLFNKRLRKRLGPLRFFASGEYGEQTHRPHYHIILFGVPEESAELIQKAWPHGYARTDPLTPAAISYVAGYCSKKVGWKLEAGERIDYATGEVYDFEPPFIQMSRRPGIGGAAREHWQSWRDKAVLNGSVMPVPRFLHKAWQERASPEALKKLEDEKALTNNENASKYHRAAGEAIAIAKHSLNSAKRTKL